ncbi:MAG: hypothetical protein J5569_03585 [Oscillospiraceae bacterium]|nr:hypothetical protein [Oscillospiraceae bacterium]
MKRLIPIMLCAAALFVLAACGSSEEAGQTTQIPNPLMPSSLEEIADKDGVSITLPDGASDINAVRINTDPITDSVTFTYQGTKYTYRAAATPSLTDISGMYYEWGEPEGGELPENAPRCMLNGEGQGILLWYRDGHSFSIAVTEGADSAALTTMYEMLDAGTTVS